MISPGYRSWCYPSYMVSPYYCWFVELGFPELDIQEHWNDGGSWSIIQFLRSPVVPALTPHQQVLGPMENVEKSFGFCEKYTKELNLHKRIVWAREERKTRAMLEEGARTERHREGMAAKATEAIIRNPELTERVLKNGLKEISLPVLSRHVPKHEI